MLHSIVISLDSECHHHPSMMHLSTHQDITDPTYPYQHRLVTNTTNSTRHSCSTPSSNFGTLDMLHCKNIFCGTCVQFSLLFSICHFKPSFIWRLCSNPSSVWRSRHGNLDFLHCKKLFLFGTGFQLPCLFVTFHVMFCIARKLFI